MRDEVDLLRTRLIDVLQDRSSSLRHDDQPRRVRDQFLHHTTLVGVRVEQNGVQRSDDRGLHVAQKG